ncbi:MAG: hypothetical protein ACXABY_20135 [Candidatus Thorarchaeota archaeon]|jgi:hypothetical protein
MKYHEIFPYQAREIEEVKRGKGYWNTIKIGVFAGVRKVGEYERNYPSLFHTFHPFIGQDGKWNALYSPDYTSTRVLSLPDCKELGGEARDGFGFCPTSYFVPFAYLKKSDKEEEKAYWLEVDASWSQDPEPWANAKTGIDSGYKLSFAPFGFIAGCTWGDDSSWKIQFLDLSKAHEGIIKRDARFGYIEMASSADHLAKAVKICVDEEKEGLPDWNRVDIIFDVMKHVNLEGRDLGEV